MNEVATLSAEDLFNAQQGATLVAAITRLAERGPLAPTYYTGHGYIGKGVPPFREALAALDKALNATIKHMRQQDDGKRTTLSDEQIADLWNQASGTIYYYDPDLSNACLMKGNGWIDDDVWKRARKQGMKIGIEDMEQARMSLNKKFGKADEVSDTVPGWFPVAGVIFTGISLLFFMYIFVAGLPVESGRLIFNVLVAFAVAASGAFLGGTAAAKGNIPFFEKSPVAFSAVGGVAIFLVVLMVMKFAG